jgi:hypothetical protein
MEERANMKLPRRKINEPHPLQNIVLAAFAERERHDAATLAGALAQGSAGDDRAYQKVAHDVLGYLEAQGLLKRDVQGWYRRTEKANKVLPELVR